MAYNFDFSFPPDYNINGVERNKWFAKMFAVDVPYTPALEAMYIRWANNKLHPQADSLDAGWDIGGAQRYFWFKEKFKTQAYSGALESEFQTLARLATNQKKAGGVYAWLKSEKPSSLGDEKAWEPGGIQSFLFFRNKKRTPELEKEFDDVRKYALRRIKGEKDVPTASIISLSPGSQTGLAIALKRLTGSTTTTTYIAIAAVAASALVAYRVWSD
jgi:hypothetical protein